MGSDNSLITTNTATFDLAGRQTGSVDALNPPASALETRDGATGHTVRTTTYPDGSTRIETYAQDHALLSVGGTAAHPLFYTYGVDAASGPWQQETRVGDNGAQTEWTKTYTDPAGRACKTVSAAGALTQSFFNAGGQLARTVDPDGVTTLYAYNARGEQETVALDMNRNGQIDYVGSDRIRRTQRSVVAGAAHGVSSALLRTTTSEWTTDGADSPLTVSVVDQTPNGRQSWETRAGLSTESATVCDAASATCTTTVTTPDAATTVSVTQAGRLLSTTRRDSAGAQLSAITYHYDGQLLSDWATADPLAGFTVASHLDGLGRRDTLSVKDAGGATLVSQGYGYDGASRLGSASQGAASATYAYLPNSAADLLDSIACKQNGATVMTLGHGRDLLDRLYSVSTTKPNATTVSAFTYGYNPANQRTARRSPTGASGSTATTGWASSAKPAASGPTAVPWGRPAVWVHLRRHRQPQSSGRQWQKRLLQRQRAQPIHESGGARLCRCHRSSQRAGDRHSQQPAADKPPAGEHLLLQGAGGGKQPGGHRPSAGPRRRARRGGSQRRERGRRADRPGVPAQDAGSLHI